ncbi:hypothetical protein BH11PSE5_BH11PSE5_07300 [soil metagenome]
MRQPTDRFWKLPSFIEHVVNGRYVGLDLRACNIPSEGDYIAAYCRRTGRDGIDGLNFYVAFSLFRLAAIIHGIKGRLIRGTASSPQASQAVEQLERIAALALAQTRN